VEVEGGRNAVAAESTFAQALRGTIRRVATVRNTPEMHGDRERLVSAAPVEDDSSFELKLRPQRLAEFI